MQRLKQLGTRVWHRTHHAYWLVLAGYLWLADSPLVLAAKKQKEAAAAPTKSYVFPYIIVMAVVGVGLMAVLRPNSRLAKPLDMHTKEEK